MIRGAVSALAELRSSFGQRHHTIGDRSGTWRIRLGEKLRDRLRSENTRVPVGHGRLRCFQSCAFHLIVVAVQHLPVCIHKVHLAVAGCKLVP
jgi:hypothetical protein